MRQTNGIAALIVAGLVSGMPSPASAAPTADAIIAHYVDALGGRKAAAAVNSLLIRGAYVEGEERDDHAALVRMRPYYKLVGDPDNASKDFAEGYDGSSWEYYIQQGWVFRTVGAAAAAGRHANGVLGPLVDYREQGLTLSVIGTAKIGGRTAWQIRVHMRDDFEQDEFVDARTWLWIAERKVAPIHAFGSGITTETRWSDFRKTNGVLLPFRSDEVEIATGKVLNSFITREAVINRTFDPAVFSPPAFTHTPLQTLGETLYVTRDDPKTVMWTYYDFRRAHPDTDTNGAMRTVGYLILKTGQVESAMQLLKANVDEYPKSAAAAFGLGRAYQTGGRLPEAKAEFERALALDPKEQRAADALKALENGKPE